MRLSRRKILHLAAGAVALPGLPHLAFALDYPTRPVRIIVGFPAGGPGDIVARLTGKWLSERLGQSFFIDNKPGVGGNVAAESAAHAAADGYTLLQFTPSNAISVSLHKKLNYDPLRDLTPVAGVVRAPLVMEVNPSLPVKSVTEFISYAKANSGRVNLASAGIGTTPHLAGELFKMMAGIELIHVPYRGGAPALIDLLGGQVQILFDPIPASLGYIRDGKLRALAVTTVERSEALPNVPVIADTLPGYEASNWWGLCAPKGTPAAITDLLNRTINAALLDPSHQKQLADLGGSPLRGSAADFGRLIAADSEKWAKVVKFAGIKPE
jgi:tripartite-type tricarboxylate transporter receptor subunit TctC